MNTKEDTKETGNEIIFVDALHESLVNHKIITNPEWLSVVHITQRNVDILDSKNNVKPLRNAPGADQDY